MDADGEGLVRLTRDGPCALARTGRPDGKALLYTSFVQGFPDVYVAELSTGHRRRVSGFAGLNSGAAMSPDGKRVALVLSKDGNPELYVIRS